MRDTKISNRLFFIIDTAVIAFAARHILRFNEINIKKLKKLFGRYIEKRIAIERFIYHIENSDNSEEIIKLCEKTDLIDYEMNNLYSRDYHKAALACKKLGDLRAKKAIPQIRKLALKDPWELKYNALMALSKIGDLEGLKQFFAENADKITLSTRSLLEIADSFYGDKTDLYKSLIGSRIPFIQSIFIKSAGNIKMSALSSEIIRNINDNKNVKIACIRALGQFEEKKYENFVLKFLEDSEWEVRAAAAKSLGKIGTDKSLPFLSKALTDREWWVRYNAAWAIIELPNGMEIIDDILNGSDKFAKDMIISVMEATSAQQLKSEA